MEIVVLSRLSRDGGLLVEDILVVLLLVTDNLVDHGLGLRNLVRLLSRGRGELGLDGDSGLAGRGVDRGAGAATQHLLDLAGVVASVLLADSGDLLSLLLGNASDLGGLSANDIRCLLDLRVDELLVAGVNEGHEEGERGAENGKTPVGNKLDEVVGNESCNGGLRMMR